MVAHVGGAWADAEAGADAFLHLVVVFGEEHGEVGVVGRLAERHVLAGAGSGHGVDGVVQVAPCCVVEGQAGHDVVGGQVHLDDVIA